MFCAFCCPTHNVLALLDLRGASSAIEMEVGQERKLQVEELEDDDEDEDEDEYVEKKKKKKEVSDITRRVEAAESIPRVVVTECKFVDNECGVLLVRPSTWHR